MFKSVISKTLVIASLLVGGFLLKVSAAPIAEDVNLYNHYNLFYGLNHEDLLFMLHHGYGFKTNHVLTASDVDLNLVSDYALLVNLTTNEVIYEKNAYQRTYPASLTKMMTVLVGIEHRPDGPITIDIDYNTLAEEGAAIAGFVNGESVSYDDLLYGTMLPSGADAALMIAKVVAGSEEGFVALMNEKAQELGMEDTHFTNVVGLHDDNHYSTPLDLAILEKVALKNDEFREIFSAKSYTTTSSSRLTFTSRMFDRMGDPVFDGGEVLGGKTGYTEEAGLCLASYATDGKNEYALVTTHANGSPYTPQYHVLDALEGYDYFLN